MPRPPVVVILGHVDHGKTTLTDFIRKSNVVARESGGITQHVGAYVISHQGKPMTLLDTPGHAAFAEMRSRGANVADVAILVVAADDGVKPQTKEAIDTIRAAQIPFVVAINKIDKGNADVERTKNELTEAGVFLEGWGGDTPNVEISAKEGIGVDALLDLVGLVGEMSEALYADDAQAAQGTVIEAHRDAQRGSVATLLVRQGTLRVGESIAAGKVSGKVKALESFAGEPIREAGPSSPAVILGLRDVPDVGDSFRVAINEAGAEEYAAQEASRRVFEQRIAQGNPEITVALLLKGDVVGSLEAMTHELKKLQNPHVAIEILGADTGEVNESDVKRAASLGATLFGFRARVRPPLVAFAERVGATIRTFEVIYEFVDAVKELCAERLPKQVTREDLGSVKLLATFRSDPPRHVVGGMVTKGAVKKNSQFELLRQPKDPESAEEIIGAGDVLETQMGQIAVDEIPQNKEGGLLVKYRRGGPAQVGDIVRVFVEHEEKPKLFT